jgi:hypothetical protein
VPRRITASAHNDTRPLIRLPDEILDLVANELPVLERVCLQRKCRRMAVFLPTRIENCNEIESQDPVGYCCGTSICVKAGEY